MSSIRRSITLLPHARNSPGICIEVDSVCMVDCFFVETYALQTNTLSYRSFAVFNQFSSLPPLIYFLAQLPETSIHSPLDSRPQFTSLHIHPVFSLQSEIFIANTSHPPLRTPHTPPELRNPDPTSKHLVLLLTGNNNPRQQNEQTSCTAYGSLPLRLILLLSISTTIPVVFVVVVVFVSIIMSMSVGVRWRRGE